MVRFTIRSAFLRALIAYSHTVIIQYVEISLRKEYFASKYITKIMIFRCKSENIIPKRKKSIFPEKGNT